CFTRDRDRSSKLRARDLVFPFRRARMAPQQRLRVYYILALGYAAAWDYDAALYYLNAALGLVAKAGAHADFAELYELRAHVFRATLRLSACVADCQKALTLLASAERIPGGHDFYRELYLLGFLAQMEFHLTLFEPAERHVAEGLALARRLQVTGAQVASLHFAQAHLDLVRGRYESALRFARGTATAYREEGSTATAARAQVLLADVLIRCAEHVPGRNLRDTLLNQVRTEIHRGVEIAHAAHDDLGNVLLILSDIRLSREMHRNEDRVHRIENLLKLSAWFG